MKFKEIEANDIVIVFRDYGKVIEKRKVEKSNGYCLTLENGEKIYEYNTGSEKVDVVKYEDELWQKAEIAYKIKMISYALNFNKNLRSCINKETLEMIESLLDKEEVEKTVSMAYTLGSLERENRFIYDFISKENKIK